MRTKQFTEEQIIGALKVYRQKLVVGYEAIRVRHPVAVVSDA